MNKIFSELCYACRVGDKENVDRLASTGVNLNAVDEFDNSPLFLASLCGHEEVVKLLLERGAVCDRDRYEGARCIYGALTDSIRDILLQYDISKAVDLNQPFVMHLSSLLKESAYQTHDICITSLGSKQNNRLRLHKFILNTRSPGFAGQVDFFNGGKHCIEIPSSVSPTVLEIVTKFIYLVPVLHEIDARDMNCLIDLSALWGMSELKEFLERVRHVIDPSEKSTMMVEYQHRITERAREQLCCFVNDNILRNAVDVGPNLSLRSQELISMFNSSAFPDLIVVVENSMGLKRFYPCHLAILSRSNYFKIMFDLPLAECFAYKQFKAYRNIPSPTEIPTVSFPPCEFEVAELLLRYLYYDASEIPWQYAMDVLLIADHLLEDRVKSMAAVVITQSKDILEEYSIFQILYLGWETRMERLEHYAAKIVANDIQRYAKDPELKKAIMLSSTRISIRQETDSIEFVDDMRYYLLQKYAFEADDVEFLGEEDDEDLLKASGFSDYMKDNSTIEALLGKLNLQA
ncbi:hypothetical protein HG536_0F03170 [Torulaspora globosa]|uniref:BTB domain-containing protein n=1 Tax=Torulaspora globosa TaxID=48254 RepID=A0A7G3ZKF6_9SACH|nr:uncharacterized protein HG536_0F03170 [Torulaspora globosa]QLL33992.1 hypothetical protein HG536_0F03170 [Torulaspora globosa]